MAGEIKVQTTLTQKLIDEIAKSGLTLQVQVDCSHNAFVKTRRADRPDQPIISKAIELDTTLLAINDAKRLGAAISNLQAARTMTPLFLLYQSLTRLNGGVAALALRNIKIEFPNFDNTIINLLMPPPSIQPAIQACQALTALAFNALPDHVRNSMSMYERTDSMNFKIKSREPSPRVAIS